MALTDKLSAIGDAIRFKTGVTSKLTLDQMPVAISSISGGTDDLLESADIPGYVRVEAAEVIRKVNAVRKDDDIILVTMSDPHHMASQTGGWQSLENQGNLDAMRAAKILSYAIPVDAFLFCGDATFGHTTTTIAQLKEQVNEIKTWLEEVGRGTPILYTPGNHDTGEYNELVGADWLIPALQTISNTEVLVEGDADIGHPYAAVLPENGLAIICLNTSEGETTGASYTVSDGQVAWFAAVLAEFGALDGIFAIMSHYPLDYGGASKLSDVLHAYITGGSFIGFNFAGRNKAKFVGQFHGHTHCLKTDYLHTVVGDTATAYDAKRIATPSMSFYRTNEYTTPFHGIMFGEDTTYAKSEGAKDTAFTVNVIHPSTKTIDSICYGAGYDRVVSYGATTYYTITNSLTHATNSNSAISIMAGLPYTAMIMADNGYTIDSITVTMGGSNVPVSGGVISISAVTGNIVITVRASKSVLYTNQIPLSLASGGDSIYNGTGYQNTKRIGSGGTESNNALTFVTGFIPCVAGDVLRLGGDGVTFGEYGCMLFTYDSSFTPKTGFDYAKVDQGANFGYSTGDGNCLWKWSPPSSVKDNCAYIRISAKGDGANAIVTKNEQIV